MIKACTIFKTAQKWFIVVVQVRPIRINFAVVMLDAVAPLKTIVAYNFRDDRSRLFETSVLKRLQSAMRVRARAKSQGWNEPIYEPHHRLHQL